VEGSDAHAGISWAREVSWSSSSFVSIRSRDERSNLLDGDTHITRTLTATLVGVLAIVCSLLAQSSGGRLQISWIDVEGGASTLFVAPNGQSLLFDTGFPGNDDRDAKRITAAAKAMSLTRIDHAAFMAGDHDAFSILPPCGERGALRNCA
jgi:beta-lactamase superfamily II metal-dependent hydrolase